MRTSRPQLAPRTLAPALGLALVVAGLSAPAPAVGQSFDEDRYEALVSECDAILTRVDATLSSGDNAMAPLFLDLGWAACSQAAQMVRSVWAGLDASVRAEYFDDVFGRETHLAGLLAAVGDCARGAQVLAWALGLAEVVPEAWTERVAALAHDLLSCLPPGGIPAERRLTLSAGEAEAQLQGELTALTWQADRFDDCPGTFPFPPSYRLELASAGHLTVELHAGRGYRLAVVHGGEVHCGSAAGELSWLELELDAGVYDVFVGYDGPSEPSDTDFGVTFSLRPAGATSGEPSHGVARLGPDAPSAHLRGHTVGSAPAAERFGTDCLGYVPDGPNHRLTLSAPGDIAITLTSAMSRELSLALVGDGVVQCAGPTAEGNASLELALEAGSYDVFVGEVSPWGTGYEIDFTLLGEPPPSGPRLGAATLPAEGPELRFEGTAPTGSGAATRPDCAGLFDPTPDVVLDVTETSDWAVMVESSGDTSLAVVGPAGTWCNDNFAGLNPGVFRTFEPGEYQVFVGARSAPSGFAFELSVVRD